MATIVDNGWRGVANVLALAPSAQHQCCDGGEPADVIGAYACRSTAIW